MHLPFRNTDDSLLQVRAELTADVWHHSSDRLAEADQIGVAQAVLLAVHDERRLAAAQFVPDEVFRFAFLYGLEQCVTEGLEDGAHGWVCG